MTICRKGPIELSAAIVTRGGVQSVLFGVSDSYHVKASFESGGAYSDRECLEMALASFDRQAVGFDEGIA